MTGTEKDKDQQKKDPVDEAADESFPASDPPAFTASEPPKRKDEENGEDGEKAD